MFTDDLANTPLTVLLQRADRAVMDALLTALSPRFPGISAAHLAFFGALDCGVTHASAAAARLGISRQAVSRTVHDLVSLGLLEQPDGSAPGLRSTIRMTARGEALALAGRAELARLEDSLGGDLGASLRRALDRLATVS